MSNIIVLLSMLGILMLWTLVTALLVPLAVVSWMLRRVIGGLEWLRNLGRV